MRNELPNKSKLEKLLASKSPYEIAEMYNTYSNKIRRLALKYGIPLKNKSAAQKLALKSGRNEHPTEGTTRTAEVKAKISEGVAKNWEEMDEDKKDELREKYKQNWKDIPADKKNMMFELAAKAVRKTAEEGSRTEKFLRDELTKKGFQIIFHREHAVVDTKLEIDLMVPALKTVIEINGVSHYQPIRGEDKLKKVIAADSKKYGLLISAGYCVVVVKHIVKTVSDIYHRRLLEKVVEQLELIKKEFPKEGDRLIEVEP